MILEEMLATLEKARAAILASPYAKKQISKAALVRVLNEYSPKPERMTLAEVASAFSAMRSQEFTPPRELALAPTFGNLSPPLPGRISPGALRGNT